MEIDLVMARTVSLSNHTTVRINPDLKKAAAHLAIERQVTFAALVERGLRLVLDEDESNKFLKAHGGVRS